MSQGLLATTVTNTVHLTVQTRVIGGVLALIFFIFLVELVRRHRLQERYTVAWFAAGVALLVMVVVPDALYWLAQALGIRDTNVALFAVAILACLGLLLNLTVVVSRLAEQSTRLAQELAIERANRQAEVEAIEEAVPAVRDRLELDREKQAVAALDNMRAQAEHEPR